MASRSTRTDDTPLVVVVGETASGKTALAIELAKRFNGEIICADSRTVYIGMDIGTAKPTAEERGGIPHYGLDVVEPGERFSAYDFQQLAGRAVADITARGKLPIMVGGTGLYIDSVLYGFQFRPAPLERQRAELQELSIEVLQRKVADAGYDLPANATNKRHLTRLLESGPAPRQVRKLRPNTVVVGLRLPNELLRARITARVDQMVAAGLVDEVRGLVEHFAGSEALRAPGYKAIARYLSGECTLHEAKREFVRSDMNLAKRQRTWFKRNRDIQWLSNGDRVDESVALVTTLVRS